MLRRITLPHEPELLYGTTASQTVLIEGMDSWMVTNLASGKTVTLDFGATSPLDIHVLVQAGRWWVLGTDSGSTAYLLDVQSGKLQDLASVGIKQLASPTFAPGEGALLAYAPGPTLIRTGSPAVVRSVAQGEAASASFSPDGARVIYTLKSGSSWNVVSESMDGSESQTLLTSSVPLIAEFAQDTDHLLIVDTKGIAVFTISSGKAILVSTAATIDSVISLGWSTGRPPGLPRRQRQLSVAGSRHRGRHCPPPVRPGGLSDGHERRGRTSSALCSEWFGGNAGWLQGTRPRQRIGTVALGNGSEGRIRGRHGAHQRYLDHRQHHDQC